jgi:hypothetical protein
VAEETVGRAALPWLTEMARRDRDLNNRSLALQELRKIDVEAIRPLVHRLRSQLQNTDHDVALDAAKALVFIEDKESLAAMRRLADSWDPKVYYRKILETYILALDGRSDVIFERIRRHDHVCMGWLAYAASAFVRTPEAHSVLEWGAETLPDDQCRLRCQEGLREGKWLSTHGE